MDVAQALADLTEISTQIEAAVLFGADGAVEGSTLKPAGAAQALAAAAAQLLDRADALRSGEAAVTQVEAALGDGAVFVVRDGSRRIAATTVANPTVGLVFYDLKSCLRDSAPAPEPEPGAGSAGGDAADARPEAAPGSRSARRGRRPMKRKVLGLLGFATGIFAGSVVFRRQFGNRRDRVEVYFDDGAMVSYVDGAPEAVTLLDAARDALRAARE